MAEGKLQTAGSSFFLKKRYGTGYKLICVKKSGCDTEFLLNVLKEYAPDTTIEADAASEVIYVINESHLPIFQNIMKRLEDQADELRITSFGCNLTTLEEVFLKLGTETHAESHQEEDATSESVTNLSTTITFNDLIVSGKVSGATLVFYQVQAMLLKKFHYFRRNQRSFLYMVASSIVMKVILLSAPSISFFSAPELHIGLGSYDDTTSIIKGDSADLATAYQGLLRKKDDYIMTNQDMQSFALSKANESLASFNRRFMVGASFDTTSATAWFNGQHFHTMPLTLNLVNRALVKTMAGKDFDIDVTNKPFSWSPSDDDGGFNPQKASATMPLMLFFYVAMYWPSVFIAFYIKERESRAKLLQMISGVNRFTFWLSSFLFDYLIFVVAFALYLCAVAMYQRPNFDTFGALSEYFVIFAFYAFGTLPSVYAFSYLFASHSTGESMATLAGILRKFRVKRRSFNFLTESILSWYRLWYLRLHQFYGWRNLESRGKDCLLGWIDATAVHVDGLLRHHRHFVVWSWR